MTTAVVMALALAAVAAKSNGPGSDGAANKVAASGSTATVTGPHEKIELLSASVKLSTPEDLILSVALECSIHTDLFTAGNSEANSSGTLEVWIEIDGQPVPVSADDTGEDRGEVTYCNRAYGRQTVFGDDEEHSIRSHIHTKQAHAFNWLGLDEIWAAAADDNVHDIKVFGRLSQTTSTEGSNADASALVVVGKRTLIIEPTKVANGETVEMN